MMHVLKHFIIAFFLLLPFSTSDSTAESQDMANGGYVQRAFELLKRQKKILSSEPLKKVLKSFDKSIISEVLAHPEKFRLNEFDHE